MTHSLEYSIFHGRPGTVPVVHSIRSGHLVSFDIWLHNSVMIILNHAGNIEIDPKLKY